MSIKKTSGQSIKTPSVAIAKDGAYLKTPAKPIAKPKPRKSKKR